MNILVTGANGQLGNELRVLSCGKKEYGFVFSDISDVREEQLLMLRKLGGESVPTDTLKLDITDIEAVRKTVKEKNIGAIINCAAYTNVEGAEDNEALAQKLNSDAPDNLALVAREAGAFLVHISTDYVFGADPYNTPCSEDRKGTPTGVYGKTKLSGEQAVIGRGGNYVILRTAWLYSEFGKNFLKTMLELTSTKPQLKVVFDQAGTPTYAGGLAGAILTILSDYSSWRESQGSACCAYPRNGIYNYSDEGVCSWYDFTVMIARKAGNENCRILPCHSNEFPSKVVRPAYSVLDKTKIKAVFGVEPRYWLFAMEGCLKFFLP